MAVHNETNGCGSAALQIEFLFWLNILAVLTKRPLVSFNLTLTSSEQLAGCLQANKIQRQGQSTGTTVHANASAEFRSRLQLHPPDAAFMVTHKCTPLRNTDTDKERPQ